MKLKNLLTISLFIISTIIYSLTAKAQSSCVFQDNPFMKLEILASGDIKFSVTYSAPQYYVEVFGKKGTLQHIAKNIVSSVVSSNGKYTYSHIEPASTYAIGDAITYRFYSYEAGKPGMFIPGPIEQLWSNPVVYKKCTSSLIVYVSTTGADTNPGTIAQPVATVFKGLSLAQQNGASQVRVAQGSYSWTVTPTSGDGLALVNGISLLGGYSPNFANRSLSPSDLSTLTIVYNGRAYDFKYYAPTVVRATDITSPTILEGFNITGGFSTNDASGLLISNSNSNLIVRNNNISGNGYQISCPWVCGGNLAVKNSSAQIYNNTVTNGYKSNGQANDLLISGVYSNGTKSDIHNNTFTCNGPSSISGISDANFHDNNFTTNCASGSTSRISLIDNNVVVESENEEINVEVYNLTGRLMLNSNSNISSLNGLPAGAYIISVTINGNRETKLTVVQ